MTHLPRPPGWIAGAAGRCGPHRSVLLIALSARTAILMTAFSFILGVFFIPVLHVVVEQGWQDCEGSGRWRSGCQSA